MNQRNYIRKWPLMLLQGILLVLISLAFFFLPNKPLADYKNLSAPVALLNGVIFIFGYFFADPFDKSQTELVLGTILLAASLFHLFFISPDQNGSVLFLAGYMMVNAFFYAGVCWNLRAETRFYRITMILPVYTLFVVSFILTSLTETFWPLHIVTGFQFLWCGITALITAFVSRRLEEDFKKPISHFRIK